jgi:putative ABC transport system ATP-binding protein
LSSATDTPPAAPAVLRLEGARRTYDGGAVVPVAGVDLVVREGDLVAITGPSGSGKSTLLNLMGLLDQPTAGTVTLPGEEHASAGRGGRGRLAGVRGRMIGFLFQDGILDPARTARENVLLGLRFAGVPRLERAALADGALGAVGVADRRDATAATLSGGERQRVALARAIAHRPRLLLCDEPTGNLDDDTSLAVFDLLAARAAAGSAVVVVTHDARLAQRCRSWAVLRGGELTWMHGEPSL